MIPVKQTILHDPANGKHGNCMSAVLASLLHLPIESIPVFSNEETWQTDLNAWLRPHGLAYVMLGDFAEHCATYGIKGLHCEVAGTTSRSADVLHACVGVDGVPTFDPHPDNTGLTQVSASGVFVLLNPWHATAPDRSWSRPAAGRLPVYTVSPEATAGVEAAQASAGTAACTYPKCKCPFDAPADPNWCARGLQPAQQVGDPRPESERRFSTQFEVWQGDKVVASLEGPRGPALTQMLRYVDEHKSDGPMRIFEVQRHLVKQGSAS